MWMINLWFSCVMTIALWGSRKNQKVEWWLYGCVDITYCLPWVLLDIYIKICHSKGVILNKLLEWDKPCHLFCEKRPLEKNVHQKSNLVTYHLLSWLLFRHQTFSSFILGHCVPTNQERDSVKSQHLVRISRNHARSYAEYSKVFVVKVKGECSYHCLNMIRQENPHLCTWISPIVWAHVNSVGKHPHKSFLHVEKPSPHLFSLLWAYSYLISRTDAEYNVCFIPNFEACYWKRAASVFYNHGFRTYRILIKTFDEILMR